MLVVRRSLFSLHSNNVIDWRFWSKTRRNSFLVSCELIVCKADTILDFRFWILDFRFSRSHTLYGNELRRLWLLLYTRVGDWEREKLL